jgi:polar amino acid transport system substrate-binding protein
MKASWRGLPLFFLVIILIGSALAQSQESARVKAQAPEIRAAVGVFPPYVMMEGGQLTGFSIDIWNEIAARLKLRTNYQMMPDVDTLLNSLRSNRVDVIATGTFYSTERDREAYLVR